MNFKVKYVHKKKETPGKRSKSVLYSKQRGALRLLQADMGFGRLKAKRVFRCLKVNVK